jgi:hypothetical protein
MRRLGSRLAATLAVALVTGALALPAAVAANTGEPITQTGGMTANLPLLGVPGGLTVAVTLDPVGNISGVVLTPVGDFTATTTEPGMVKFSNAAGTTTVSVKAKGDKLSIGAKTATLAGLVGPGTWAANVFGPGTMSTVAYTIGVDGSGNPTVTIGTVTPGAGITFEVLPASGDSDDDDASASAGVRFELNGYVKRLKIAVKVDHEDGRASLRITLSGKDRQKLTGTLVALGGARTWSAHLCDGTVVSVAYHVDADGTVAFDSSVGPTASIKSGEHGLKVRFDGTKVGVKISLRQNEDGTYTLQVKGSSGHCGGGEHDGESHGDSHRDGDSHDGNRQDGEEHGGDHDD